MLPDSATPMIGREQAKDSMSMPESSPSTCVFGDFLRGSTASWSIQIVWDSLIRLSFPVRAAALAPNPPAANPP